MRNGNNITLGITGGIGAYKSADLASKLIQRGQKVSVVMTREAAEFVSPLTFSSITGNPVANNLFDPASPFAIQHVSLAQTSDVVVVAPATANIIARIAAGIADDMLTCTVLATKAPVLLAPAMDANMYENPVTQDNIKKLKDRGFIFIGPDYGHLASGLVGLGRLADNEEIIDIIGKVLGQKRDLAGRNIVITAGGTQEPIDPVRFISNYSSGKMGYAIAEAARDRGANTTLISGPTALNKPAGMEFIAVKTAEEMLKSVHKVMSGSDVLIMAAAVADFAPSQVAAGKIKKKTGDLVLNLKKTRDILSSIKGNFVKIGFAAESENLEEEAFRKLKSKNLALIVANDITSVNSGFGVDTNQVVIIDKNGKKDRLPLMLKVELADKILDRLTSILMLRKISSETDNETIRDESATSE